MEPQVRYARASDGVTIAYWRLGDGPPLVQTPLMPYSHIEMEWQIPEMRRWYERLAQTGSLVRYDGRGNGSSARDVSDPTVEAGVLDLEAVIDQLGPEPVALMGVLHSGPAAIAYAARNPERVSHLILWCTYGKGTDYWRSAQAEGLRALRLTDYELFLRTGAHELVGWSEGEEADRFAEVMRNAVSPEDADRLIAATREFDVKDALSDIACPTLVVHGRHVRWIDISVSRSVASSVRGARLAIVDGPSPLPGAGEIDAAARTIDEFLERGSPQRPPGPSRMAVRTVLFTDLVEHTRLMTDLGDERGREVVREYERITRESLSAHAGVEVKTLGDGFLASFGSVSDAVECAVTLQRRVAEWNAGEREAGWPTLEVRVGMHAGEPIEEDGDLFGATVILASRIAGEAAAGEILVGNAVRELCAGKGFSFQDRGEFEAKGFVEPVKVWQVGWGD